MCYREVYKEKSMGPSTEPCGTPVGQDKIEDRELPIWMTECDLRDMNGITKVQCHGCQMRIGFYLGEWNDL